MALFVLLLVLPLPDHSPAYSYAVYAKDGSLLSAVTSSERQWHLPLTAVIPEKLKQSIISYEDEYFYYHLGVNPISALKAIKTNWHTGKIIRGASTIPMQVMRMRNKNAPRSWSNKLKEMIWSIKYSLLNSKNKVLNEWADLAPFGGNTIGVTAASLRYFGRNLDNLSWSEYALLAVLPNGPSTANLSLNRESLKKKRDFLLRKLCQKHYFNESDLPLFLDEDLPVSVKEVPQEAYHFLQFCKSQNADANYFSSTLDKNIQRKVNEILDQEAIFLKTEDINNAAAVVIDASTNDLLAYIGNIKDKNGKFYYNDLVQAPRSYGSLLKPLLYGYALANHYCLPHELIADIPTNIGDFRPENFDKKYRGAAPLDEVIIQSLNVPSVRLLNEIGNAPFYEFLHKTLEIQGLDKGQDYYGLSIILGGGESTLWDLSRIYKGLSRNYGGRNRPFEDVKYLSNLPIKIKHKSTFQFSPFTIKNLTNTITDLTRPREEKSWELYAGNKKIAWKTGTSFGHRDAWALGYSGKYMVGVWVGNETGAGRTDLTGIKKAAPLLFKIFNALPEDKWFDLPPQTEANQNISVCRESGRLSGPMCKMTSIVQIENAVYKYKTCNYHEIIMVNEKGNLISQECITGTSKKDTLFKLPSYMEYFYIASHPEYQLIPEIEPSCPYQKKSLQIIYPSPGIKIFLPKESELKINQLIAKAYGSNTSGKLYWFLDDKYMFSTENQVDAQCLLEVVTGRHRILLMDDAGNRDEVIFEVLARDG